jgi:hypothetical protein
LLADNCCKSRIMKKAPSCNDDHPPCVLPEDYATKLKEYEEELPKRHAMQDCNKAMEITRLKQAMGVEKGEFLVKLYIDGETRYQDALDIAVKVERLCEDKIDDIAEKQEPLKAKIADASDEDKEIDPLTGTSKVQIWKDDLESDKSEVKFYKMIIKNSKEVAKSAKEGLKNVAALKKEVMPAKDVDKFQLKLNELVDDSLAVYKEAELLWKQWLDSSKDYSCGIPAGVAHAKSQCTDGNTKYSPKCAIVCEEGYDDPKSSRNALRCLKQGKFGKELYGEWLGMASCIGRNCGVPSDIKKSKTVKQEIRFPHVAQYNCYEGFTMDGKPDSAAAFTVACQATGHYGQNASHKCDPVKCGEAPKKANTEPNPGVFYFSDVVKYKCLKGYTTDEAPGGISTFSTSCQANGKFTSAMDCKPVRCGPPPDFTNTAAEGEGKVDKYFGDSVSFTCKPGYTLDKQPGSATGFTLVCGANGEFKMKGVKDGTEPLPKCQAVSAGMSPKVVHSKYCPPAEYFFGEKVLCAAVPGFSTLSDPKKGLSFSMNVSTEGEYVGLKEFKPVSCGAPPKVDFSKPQFDSAEAVYGDVLSYECEAGYSVDALDKDASKSFSITCEKDADFSKIPGEGKCVNINDCLGHTCGPFGECVDKLLNYSCKCDSGFAETYDKESKEKVCGNINDCGEEACGVGKCKDLINDYKCICPKGYEQTGSGKAKTCTKKICGVPPVVENSATSPVEWKEQKASFQDKILYQCAEGHTIGGKAGNPNHFHAECLASKKFEKSVGNKKFQSEVEKSDFACKPNVCPDPPDVKKASIDKKGDKVVYQDKIKYKCDKGYTVDGSPSGDGHFSTTCGADGNYGAILECKPVTCGEPEDVANSFRESGQVYFPDKRPYKCLEGFTTDGEAPTKKTTGFEVECQADGILTKEKECIAVSCGKVGEINVKYSSTEDEGVVRYPRVTQIACNDGYTVGGDPDGEKMFGVQCQKDAKFAKHDEHACDPVRCGPPPKFKNAKLAGLKGGTPATEGLTEEVFYHSSSLRRLSDCKFPLKVPQMTRVVSKVAYGSTGGKWSGLSQSNRFAVRWTGLLKTESAGKYMFSIESDDGSRLYLDDKTIVDNDGLHGMRTKTGDIALKEGESQLKVEMFENGGGAGMKLKFKGPDTDNQIVYVSDKYMMSKGNNLNFEETATYECDPGFSAGGEFDAPTKFISECLANGQVSYPPLDMQCRNVNACEKQTCGPRGECIDTVGESFDAYTCNCTFGFEPQMVKGNLFCGDIDDCGKKQCGVGKCKDLIGDYTCICPSGYYVAQVDKEKTCVPVECEPKAPVLKNGKMLSDHKGPVEYPASIRYQCNKGYSTDGSVADAKQKFHAVCKADGSFYGMQSCQKISCGSPTVWPFAKVITPEPTSSMEYEEEAKYRCIQGYKVGGKLDGDKEFDIKCQASGSLSDPKVCEPVKCGKAPSVPHGKAGISGDVFFGMNLVYKCNLGYSMDGTKSGDTMFSTSCKEDGSFTDEVPQQCAAERQTCQCDGQVKYGYGNRWSEWKSASGSIQCNNGVFGDPAPGQGKICICQAEGASSCKPICAGAVPQIKNAILTEFDGKPFGNPEDGLMDGPMGEMEMGPLDLKRQLTQKLNKSAQHPVACYPQSVEFHCHPDFTVDGSPGGATKFTARVTAQGEFYPALPDGCEMIAFTLRGTVKNARSGRFLDGVKVEVAGTDISATSDYGYFTLFKVPAGQDVEVKYSRSGFITTTRKVNVTGDINVGSVLDMSMSPRMRNDEWRAVLKWGPSPSDLDTYGKWGWSKVCWYQRNQFGSDMGGVLEVDRTQGYGPETFYLHNVGKCQGSSAMCDIRYIINDYTESGKMFEKSDAKVTLYTGERVAGSWDIKKCKATVSKDGNWWHVFTLDGRTNKLKWNCEQPKEVPITPGLREEVFYFDQKDFLPNLMGRTPDMQRSVFSVNYPSPWAELTRKENFAARWEGSIRIRTGGEYRFSLKSSDGSKLWIDEKLLVNNGGVHNTNIVGNAMTLDASLHGLRIDFFKGKGTPGDAQVVFKWKGPDCDCSEMTVVPTSALKQNPVLHGLLEEGFYFDKSIRSLPNLNGKSPNLARRVDNVNYGSTRGTFPGFARKDRFAVRWTGFVEIHTSGEYTFYTKSDDGSAMWIANAPDSEKKLVSNDGLHGMRTRSGEITLDTGNHHFRIEMFENGGGAGCQFHYKGADSEDKKVLVPKSALLKTAGEPPIMDVDAGLKEEHFYFGQGGRLPDLNGRFPDKVRKVSFINYPGTGSSWPGMSRKNNFAIRWTGSLLIRKAGRYDVSIESDDGSVLYMKSSRVIDNDGLHGMRTKKSTKSMAAGAYTIRVEMFEKGGGAGCKFRYSGPDTSGVNRIVPRRALKQTSARNGLLRQIYNFRQGRNVPSLKTRRPSSTGTDRKVNYGSTKRSWGSGFRKDNFAILWVGFVHVQTGGNYRFYIESDDGSKLWINWKLKVNNDGLHGMRTKSATQRFGDFSFKSVRMTMFERGGGAGMKFFYKGKDTSNRKNIVGDVRGSLRRIAG